MKRRNNKYLLLLILLLVVTIGYALLSTTLKITGNATVTKQNWSVYWGTPTVTQGSKSMTAPTRTEDSGDPSNTKLIWSVTLDLPGDFYEFTVDAVNAGTIDAMITGITPTVSPALPTNPDYIKYSVTYADGTTPALNHLLKKADQSTTPSTPTTQGYKVKVYYDENAATAATINNMNSSTTYTFTLDITYGQATAGAIDINAPVVASCPGCYFRYTTERLKWKDIDNEGVSQTRSLLTDSSMDYRDIKKNGQQRRVFIGQVVDANNRLTEAYTCGIKDYGLATQEVICMKVGQADYSDLPTQESAAIYNANLNYLQSASLFNGNCNTYTEESSEGFNCNFNGLDISSDSTGLSGAQYSALNSTCFSDYNGDVMCYEWQ